MIFKDQIRMRICQFKSKTTRSKNSNAKIIFLSNNRLDKYPLGVFRLKPFLYQVGRFVFWHNSSKRNVNISKSFVCISNLLTQTIIAKGKMLKIIIHFRLSDKKSKKKNLIIQLNFYEKYDLKAVVYLILISLIYLHIV